MARRDRRDKLALDKAYNFYRTVVESDSPVGLYTLANSLKTTNHAIHNASKSEFKLTIRLWQRIAQALFDKMIRSFPAYVAIFSKDGIMLNFGEELPDDGKVVMHPQGLHRIDDFFTQPINQLHPNTREQLSRVWRLRRVLTTGDDFALTECTDVCVPPSFFVPGIEVLAGEASSGKQLAYRQWWDLYWQNYCTASRKEKSVIGRRMSVLEEVWGDLYY